MKILLMRPLSEEITLILMTKQCTPEEKADSFQRNLPLIRNLTDKIILKGQVEKFQPDKISLEFDWIAASSPRLSDIEAMAELFPESHFVGHEPKFGNSTATYTFYITDPADLIKFRFMFEYENKTFHLPFV